MKTINISTVLLALLFVQQVSSQEFKGIATYKSHRKMDFKISADNTSTVIQENIQEQMKKKFQQEYTLSFNKEESIYKKEEKLEAPNPSTLTIKILSEEGSDILYKNIKENRFTMQADVLGKIFLVKDTLQKDRKWELTNEKKFIGEYECYKAISKRFVVNKKFNIEKNNFDDTSEEITTIAWYTPQIPLSNGPGDYHGLPGLILEINDGVLTLICSKIVLNPKDSFQINEPTKGKQVDKIEYEKIRAQKEREHMERFQSDKEKMIIHFSK